MKNKFKSYSFWMSVGAAVILVINNIGEVFGFKIDSEIATKIIDSVCGVLILFGILSISKSSDDEKIDEKNDEKEENDLLQKNELSNELNVNKENEKLKHTKEKINKKTETTDNETKDE